MSTPHRMESLAIVGLAFSFLAVAAAIVVFVLVQRSAPEPPKPVPKPVAKPKPSGSEGTTSGISASWQWRFRTDLNVETSYGSAKTIDVVEKYTWRFVPSGSGWKVQSYNKPDVWLGYGKAHWLLVTASEAPTWTVVPKTAVPPAVNGEYSVRFSLGSTMFKDKFLTILAGT